MWEKNLHMMLEKLYEAQKISQLKELQEILFSYGFIKQSKIVTFLEKWGAFSKISRQNSP